MAHSKGTKLKLPHGASDFLEFEDRLSKVAQVFREIREAMKTKDRDSVMLKTGTFAHHLGELEAIIEIMRGQVESQLARPAARALSKNLPEKTRTAQKKN